MSLLSRAEKEIGWHLDEASPGRKRGLEIHGLRSWLMR
jgi:hypothetical protein